MVEKHLPGDVGHFAPQLDALAGVGGRQFALEVDEAVHLGDGQQQRGGDMPPSTSIRHRPRSVSPSTSSSPRAVPIQTLRV